MSDEIERLKQRAEHLGRYYCKGFGDCINFCTNLIDGAVVDSNPANIEKIADETREAFGLVTGFYSKIPFQELHGDEAFYPLFVARELVKRFEANMNAAFQSVPEQFHLDNAKGYGIALGFVGKIYRDSFEKSAQDVRKIPGQEDFRVVVMDWRGRPWKF